MKTEARVRDEILRLSKAVERLTAEADAILTTRMRGSPERREQKAKLINLAQHVEAQISILEWVVELDHGDA